MATYMSEVPDIEAELKVMFDLPPFYDYYSVISNLYKTYEFTDGLTDSERLSEYAQVYQQFKKFVKSKESKVMSLRGNLDDVVEWLSGQMDKSDVYPKSRVEMAYNALKIQWINRAVNQVNALISEMEGSTYAK